MKPLTTEHRKRLDEIFAKMKEDLKVREEILAKIPQGPYDAVYYEGIPVEEELPEIEFILTLPAIIDPSSQ